MKLAYYSETDSLYIDLGDGGSVETKEISDGIHLDFNEAGHLVGIDIDAASKKLDLGTINLANFADTTQILRSAA